MGYLVGMQIDLEPGTGDGKFQPQIHKKVPVFKPGGISFLLMFLFLAAAMIAFGFIVRAVMEPTLYPLVGQATCSLFNSCG